MCGILGYIGKHNVSADEFYTSLELLSHRGPDRLDWAMLENEDNRCFLGHSRLAIIDLSPSGAQPMRSNCGRYIIVFNGEIYNYLELRDELIGQGVCFESHSDTEVLLAAWIKRGESCLRDLVGMFAFAVYDLEMHTLTIVRDAFGIKPIYYSSENDEFIFSSEIPPLINLSHQTKCPNNLKAYEYLVNGTYDNSELTFYDGIFQLLPGHTMTVDLKTLCVSGTKRWWNPSIKANTNVDFEQAAQVYRDMLLRSIELHLRSDVPLGIALSGGLDSSVLAACINHLGKSNKLKTFSFIAENSPKNEERWIDLVNNHIHADSCKVFSSKFDIVSDINDVIIAQGEPFASTSIYAQFMLYRKVKESGITVLIEGQGADELLAGYSGFPIQRAHSLFDEGKILSAIKFLFAWSSLPTRSLKTTMSGLIYNLLPTVIRRFISIQKKRKNIPKYINREFLHSVLEDLNYQPDVSQAENRRGRRLIGLLKDSVSGNGLNSLLRHGDRSSMRHSLESRVPFLTIEMAEFLFSLPEDYLLSKNGTTKHILREALRGIVPEEVLDRKDKIGFEPPEKDWLKKFESIKFEIFEDIRRTPLLDNHITISIVNDFFNDSSMVDSRLVWRIINYSKWYCLNFIK